jgi:hypothetical protein
MNVSRGFSAVLTEAAGAEGGLAVVMLKMLIETELTLNGGRSRGICCFEGLKTKK